MFQKISLRKVSYKNVVGYSRRLHKKIRNGRVTDVDSIRLYVTRKVPLAHLAEKDVIPKEIDGIPVDVIELGSRVVAHNEDEEPDPRRGVVRPLTPGTSIGNWGISAGTLGWYSEKAGEVFIDSNAHVFADFPNLTEPIEKRIVQPGKFDGGTLNNKIAEYAWHEPLIPIEEPLPPTPPEEPPSDCSVSKGMVQLLNSIATTLNRKTRFKAFLPSDSPEEGEGEEEYTGPYNYQDFAVARVDDGIECLYKTFDFDILNEYALVGKIFAGSLYASIICKVEYQIERGYVPYLVETDAVERFDRLRKSGRTTGDTEKGVLDTSGVIKVDYNTFEAWVDDVIITVKMSDHGDSGSSVWKKLE